MSLADGSTMRNCNTRPAGTLAGALGILAVLATRAVAQGPALDREMQRGMARADRSFERFVLVFAEVGALWLWAFASTAGYLVVAAAASVLDRHMLTLRSPAAVVHYIADGARTFFRLVRDRRTPGAARGILVAGLLYWLLPFDILFEWSYFTPAEAPWIGFVDDVLVAVLASKAFLFLCPDALIAQHALAVENRYVAAAPGPPAAGRRDQAAGVGVGSVPKPEHTQTGSGG